MSSLLVAASAGGAGSAAADQAGEEARRDTTPPLLSLYLPIPLGVPKLDRQSTGLFLPAGFRAGTLEHGEVPRAHLAELLRAAAYLDDR